MADTKKEKREPTSLNFFKANKAGTGCACSVSFNPFKGGAVYLTLIKQVKWNESTRSGSFSGGEKTTIKLGLNEIGDWIRAIRLNSQAKAYHSNDQYFSYIDFAPFIKKSEDGKPEEQLGFSLKVNRGKNEDKDDKSAWKIGLTNGEAELLSEYLKFALEHIFSAFYAESKKQRKAAEANEKPKREDQKNKKSDNEDDDGDGQQEDSSTSEDEELF